jgi:hypothetical protein
MEMFVFVTGLLLCLVLSTAVTLYVVKYIKEYQILLIPAVMLTTMAVSSLLYNNIIQEYFIGKRITTEQICTDVQKLELYWK